MFNKVTMIGRLGRDPEMRYLPDGKPVTSFSVATDTGPKDKQKTVWFRVTAWDKLGDVCNQYLHKGSLVYIEGTLSEPRTYQTKDGKTGVSLDVTAKDVRFLSPKSEEKREEPVSEQTIPEGEESIPF